MIEAKIDELIAALNANTAALGGASAPKVGRPKATPAPAPAAAPAPAPAAAAPVAPPATARVPTQDTAAPVTPAQTKAAGDDLSALAEADRATAVAILAEFGVQKMTAMPPQNIPEFHARVKAALGKLQQPAAAPSLV